MKKHDRWYSTLSMVVAVCLLALPVSALTKKGKDHYERGLKYENAQQWEKAAQEFTLALAADPSNVVYLISALYGLLILVPQYFLESRNGRAFPSAINHPEYYYGFVGVAVAWQIAFLIIAKDPRRFRPLMITTVIEKYSYGFAVLVLYFHGPLAVPILVTGLIDLILGALFAIVYKQVGCLISRPV